MNQLAISTPILLGNLRSEFASRMIHQPDSKNPALRYLVVLDVQMDECEPVYEGLRLLGKKPTGKSKTVVEVRGFGSTPAAAEAMARRVR